MSQDGSSMDKMLGKAQDALGNFLDDPEKVDKAKTKADGLLSKYMDPQQAQEATDGLEGLLKKVAHQPEEK